MSSISRRQFIHSGALATLSLAVNARAEEQKSPLNLVIVTADDLHADAMQWSGGRPRNSPHLDAFAKISFGFANLHASAPICQPSRSALMTGLVPHRNGALGFDPVRNDITTLTEFLQARGYFAAGLNKLSHMAPATKFPWDWHRDRHPDRTTECSTAESPRNPPNYRRDVLDAIGAAKAARKPFFLNANIIDPHRPLYLTKGDLRLGGVAAPELATDYVVPGFLDDLPEVRKEVGFYYHGARRCDESFGQIMLALEDANVRENTVVVFVPDHGMPFPFSKTTLYKGGTHTPCLIHAPDHLKLPRDRIDKEHYPSNVDVMPSVIELLGFEPPPGLDGRSLVPLIRGKSDPSRTEVCTHVTSTSVPDFFPSRCYRNARHSYIWNLWAEGVTKFKNESMVGLTYPAMVKAAESSSTADERLKMFLLRAPDEFYDLETDPWERRNLVSAVEHVEQLARCRAKLREHMKQTGDPLLAEFDAFLRKVAAG